MYNDNLQFDSDNLDLLDIDWEDVQYLRSKAETSINIDEVGPVTGVLEITGDQVYLGAGWSGGFSKC